MVILLMETLAMILEQLSLYVFRPPVLMDVAVALLQYCAGAVVLLVFVVFLVFVASIPTSLKTWITILLHSCRRLSSRLLGIVRDFDVDVAVASIPRKQIRMIRNVEILRLL